MSRLYSYQQSEHDFEQKIALNSSASEFIKKIMKTSEKVNNKIFYCEGIDQIKREISTKKSLNQNQQAEFLKFDFPKYKSCYHNGYMEYLMSAWYNDYGIEISPWNIWNVILHQLCQIISNDPEEYRYVFTRSDEQVQIILYDEFDIHKFIKEVTNHLPFDINDFLPNFDKRIVPRNYQESIYGLFGEMVKNYYCCEILSCSIPKVRILGTKDEWDKIVITLKNIGELFSKNCSKVEYIGQCISTVRDFIDNLDNAKYWEKFFYIEKCGSGSQEEIKGYVLKLLLYSDYTTTIVPGMISRYPFVDKTGIVPIDCFFISGIMYSYLDNDGILVPEYHYNVSYIDSNICDLSDEEIEEKKKVLRGLKLLKHFTGDYDRFHMMIDEKSSKLKKKVKYYKTKYGDHITNYEKFREIHLNDYYIYFETPDNLESKIKRDYERIRKQINIYNKLWNESNENLSKFIELENEMRREKIKSKFTVWISDLVDIKCFNKYSLYYTKMNFERWERSTKENKKLFDEIKNIVPLLLNYMVKNDYNKLYEQLMSTLHIEIYETILDYQEKNLFELPRSNGYSYNYTDPIFDFDKLNDLHFKLFLKMIMWIERTGRVDTSIKEYILEKMIQKRSRYNDELVEVMKTMLINKINNTIDQLKRYKKDDNKEISNTIKNILNGNLNKIEFEYQSLEVDVRCMKLFTKVMCDSTYECKCIEYVNKYIEELTK